MVAAQSAAAAEGADDCETAQPIWALEAAVPLGPARTARLAVLNHDHGGIIAPCTHLAIFTDAGELLAERTVERLAPGHGAHVDYRAAGRGGAANVHAVVRFTPGSRIGASLLLLDPAGNPYIGIQPCVMPDPTLEEPVS